MKCMEGKNGGLKQRYLDLYERRPSNSDSFKVWKIYKKCQKKICRETNWMTEGVY